MIFKSIKYYNNCNNRYYHNYHRRNDYNYNDTNNNDVEHFGNDSNSCEKLVTLELCKNLSLVEHIGTDKFIKRFYASDLPTDVKDRFKLLFQVRSKWTEEDLKPFIDGIVCTGKSISSILIKNTRSSMVKVTDATTGKVKTIRMYSSR